MEEAHERGLTPDAFARLHAAVAAEAHAALQVQPSATAQRALTPHATARPRVADPPDQPFRGEDASSENVVNQRTRIRNRPTAIDQAQSNNDFPQSTNQSNPRMLPPILPSSQDSRGP